MAELEKYTRMVESLLQKWSMPPYLYELDTHKHSFTLQDSAYFEFH